MPSFDQLISETKRAWAAIDCLVVIYSIRNYRIKNHSKNILRLFLSDSEISETTLRLKTSSSSRRENVRKKFFDIESWHDYRFEQALNVCFLSLCLQLTAIDSTFYFHHFPFQLIDIGLREYQLRNWLCHLSNEKAQNFESFSWTSFVNDDGSSKSYANYKKCSIGRFIFWFHPDVHESWISLWSFSHQNDPCRCRSYKILIDLLHHL